MLFMVIEKFKDGAAKRIGERFERDGRMLPAGVSYQASWIDEERMRCFQIMEAPNSEMLAPWIENWKDLVEFELVPVVSSSEFWPKVKTDQAL
jgi:hypothetical protein